MLKLGKMTAVHNERGFGLIEIVIVSAVVSVAIFSLSFVFVLASRLSNASSDKIRANFLAEEGLEVARFLRDQSWSSNFEPLVSGQDYYLFFESSAPAWSIISTDPGPIDVIFTRKFRVSDVYRDSAFDIVDSGGVIDSDSKRVEIEISWQERGNPQNLSVSTYLSDIFDN